MFLVGLTGGIASGKSTVINQLRELGVQVIDADVLARQVVEPGKKAWKQIKQEFPDVIADSGEIDRSKLGDIIFSDATKRKLLNRITHPEIYKMMFWDVVKYCFKGHQFVVLDLPLLFESGVAVNYLHKIIVVTCEEEQQVQRLCIRNNLTREGALQRITAQMPLEDKCKRSNFIINNSYALSDTESQVLSMYKTLRQSKYHWRLRFILTGSLISLFCMALWITGFI